MKTKQAIRIAQMCKNGNSSKKNSERALREAQAMNVTTFDCLRAGLLLDVADGNPHTVETWLSQIEFGDFADNLEVLTISLHQIAEGKTECASERMSQLREHIVQRGDEKSTKWLLPAVDTAMRTVA